MSGFFVFIDVTMINSAKIVFLCLLLALFVPAEASDTLQTQQLLERITALENKSFSYNGFFVRGYMQVQGQIGQRDAELNVGKPNEEASDFMRFGIRRGYLTAGYYNRAGGIDFALSITERGVRIKDAFITLNDPLFRSQSLMRAGIFRVPFSLENYKLSSERFFPERSYVFTALFPDSRDMGASISITPNGGLSCLELQGALLGGRGIHQMMGTKIAFTGSLRLNKALGKSTLFAGVGIFAGSALQTSELYFVANPERFLPFESEKNIGLYSKRFYVNGYLGANISSRMGQTELRFEGYTGKQPGTFLSSASPDYDSSLFGEEYAMFRRRFWGGYASLVQQIARSKHYLLTRVQYYDPNMDLRGWHIGQNRTYTGAADYAYGSLELGYSFVLNKNFRISGIYEWIKKERTPNLVDFTQPLRMNKGTLVAQYAF